METVPVATKDTNGVGRKAIHKLNGSLKVNGNGVSNWLKNFINSLSWNEKMTGLFQIKQNIPFTAK